MTAVSSSEQPRAAAAARPAPFDRVLPFLPLVAAYLLSVSFLGWHAAAHSSPWLFTDEIEYTQISRSIAETGDAARRGEPYDAVSIATYLLAPIWRFVDDAETAYSLAKYLGVFVMASVVFPAYALARLLVPPPHAVFAAIASASIPAMAYSRLIITEPVAYPFATLTFFLLVKAFATRRLGWGAAALAAVLGAEHVRQQLEIMKPVVIVAFLVLLWLSEPARRLRGRLPAAQWVLWAAAGLALVTAGHAVGKRKVDLYYLATTLPDRAHDFTVWPTGSLVIGIGILPAILGLAALWRPADVTLPGYRAFVSVFASAVALFILYTTLKGVYISTVFANVVNERNLIYLSPLFFVATALWLYRPTLSPLVLGGATALVAYVLVNTSYQLDYFPYSDAPGVAVLAYGNRTLSLDHAETQRILVWIAVGTLLFAAALALALPRWRRAAGVATTAVAVLVVAWELVGLNTFGNGINRLAARIRSTVPEPPTWVDRATGGEPVMYLGQGTADPNSILATEFWNRSVKHVGSVDDSAPGPGPHPVLVPYDTTGSLANDPHVRYVLTDSPVLDVRGRVVESTGLWRLIDVGGNIRLRSSWTGVFPDGWTGAFASYSFFGDRRRGVVDVRTSRAGWTGPNRPGKVTIRVGELVTPTYSTIENPCRHHDPCLSIQPRIGNVTATRTWTATSGQEMIFHIPVTAPFRVEVTVDPTFSPYEFGVGDNRQLGVQVGFAFKPRG